MTPPDKTSDAPSIRVTHHARRRIKERLGLPPRTADRLARQAYDEGLSPDHPDVPPWQCLAIRARARNNAGKGYDPSSEFKLYRGHVWVFAPATGASLGGVILLTVFAAPFPDAEEDQAVATEEPRMLRAVKSARQKSAKFRHKGQHLTRFMNKHPDKRHTLNATPPPIRLGEDDDE